MGQSQSKRRRPAPATGQVANLPATQGGWEAVSVSEFTQLALWMAATLAGLVTAVLLARGPFFRALARQVGWLPHQTAPDGRPVRPPTRERALPMLADAIVGNSKAAVASVFGPPRGAVLLGGDDSATNGPARTFWDADTWYYPLPRTGQLAMAIEFDENYARAVQFVGSPR
jgi:hypothetical protein